MSPAEKANAVPKPRKFSQPNLRFAQALIRAIEIPFAVLDSSHRILLINEPAAKTFSAAPAEIIGKKCFHFRLGQECLFCPLDRANHDLTPQENEYYDPGSKRWIHSQVFPLPFVTADGLRTFALIVEDVTPKKSFERERDAAVQKCEILTSGTVQIIQAIVKKKDPYQGEHQKEVSRLAVAIAEEMGLNSQLRENLRIAALIHDLGKIAIPAEILMRTGPIAAHEYALIRTHPQEGYDILKNIEFPFPLAEIVYQHHERIDGSGYPRGIKGEDMLIEAKILAVAEVVEAMSAHRSYRPAIKIDEVLRHIEENRGILYESRVVDACVRLIREKGYKLRES